MSSRDGGLGWRDVAPETLWRLLELAFGLGLKPPPPEWATALQDADFAPRAVLAWLYAALLQERLQRHLSPAYQETRRLLGTVRGRPMLLESSRSGDLAQGRIRCQFEELTIDRPRNRQFKAVAKLALRYCQTRSNLSPVSADLQACVHRMAEVGDARPSLRELWSEPIARHERHDGPVVELAALLLQHFGTIQNDGTEQAPVLDPDNVLMRRVFERAVVALLRQRLTHTEWEVSSQEIKRWAEGSDASPWLPVMRPDIVLTHKSDQQTVIIETKFTSYWELSRFKDGTTAKRTLKSGHLYQLYSYLRSQRWPGKVTGLLVYPYLGADGPEELDFSVQGSAMGMRTLDLRSVAGWDAAVEGLATSLTNCKLDAAHPITV